ncbi:MAG: hypothetical protein ACJ749_20420 [Flavisolibacter sp.]
MNLTFTFMASPVATLVSTFLFYSINTLAYAKDLILYKVIQKP